MGLSDAHIVYGLLLGRVFHAHHPHYARLDIPASFSPQLRAILRHPRLLLTRAPLARFLLCGAILSSLPDCDVLFAALFRRWSLHRGPTHSLLFLAASSLAAAWPVSLWLRTTRLKALLFALACGASHLASDWIGNAGLPLSWPLSRSRHALGAVTVLDGPILAANGVLLLLSERSRRPLLLLCAWLALLTAYLRWKVAQLQCARGYFAVRHRAVGDDYFVHPWAVWPRTFSLCRSSDGSLVETISTGSIAAREFVPAQLSAAPNLSNQAAVRRLYATERAVALDAALASAGLALFYVAYFGGHRAWDLLSARLARWRAQ